MVRDGLPAEFCAQEGRFPLIVGEKSDGEGSSIQEIFSASGVSGLEVDVLASDGDEAP